MFKNFNVRKKDLHLVKINEAKTQTAMYHVSLYYKVYDNIKHTAHYCVIQKPV